jgi:hypothetical protein
MASLFIYIPFDQQSKADQSRFAAPRDLVLAASALICTYTEGDLVE